MEDDHFSQLNEHFIQLSPTEICYVLYLKLYHKVVIFFIRPSFDGRIMVWRCPSVRPKSVWAGYSKNYLA